jgi:hypothetical protein
MSALDAVIEFPWMGSFTRAKVQESIDGLSTFFTCPFTGYHFGISFSFVSLVLIIFIK